MAKTKFKKIEKIKKLIFSFVLVSSKSNHKGINTTSNKIIE